MSGTAVFSGRLSLYAVAYCSACPQSPRLVALPTAVFARVPFGPNGLFCPFGRYLRGSRRTGKGANWCGRRGAIHGAMCGVKGPHCVLAVRTQNCRLSGALGTGYGIIFYCRTI